MDKYFNGFSVVVGAVGGTLAGLMGGWDLLLKIMILMILLDYFTGILKSVYTKSLSSEIGYKGIIKKVMILIIVTVAYAVQRIINTSIPVREIVITFFLANECISITENAAVCGLPLPKKLTELLIQLRGEGELK